MQCTLGEVVVEVCGCDEGRQSSDGVTEDAEDRAEKRQRKRRMISLLIFNTRALQALVYLLALLDTLN